VWWSGGARSHRSPATGPCPRRRPPPSVVLDVVTGSGLLAGQLTTAGPNSLCRPRPRSWIRARLAVVVTVCGRSSGASWASGAQPTASTATSSPCRGRRVGFEPGGTGDLAAGPRCGTHCYAAAAAHTTDTRERDHLVEQAARVRAIGVPARPDVPAGPGDTWAPARTPSSSGRSRTTSSAERPGRPRSARHATRRVPEHRVPLGHTRRNHRRPWGSCHLWWTVTTDRAGGDVRRRRTPADPGPSAGERRGPA
jgi:hypothetical protein